MIKLISFGSSSKGNCHLLYNGSSSLLLDCGVNLSKINIDQYNLKAVLITHEHLDHCKGLRDCHLKHNVPVLCNTSTKDKINNVLYSKVKVVKELKKYIIGEWEVVPIEVIHDVDNFAYIIKDLKSGLKMMYVTDTGYLDNITIKDINIWIIESNYIASEIDFEKVQNSYKLRSLHDKGHISLEESVEFVKRNFSYTTKSIVLVHIGSNEKDYLHFGVKYSELIKSSLNGLKMDFEVTAINNNLKVNNPQETILYNERW